MEFLSTGVRFQSVNDISKAGLNLHSTSDGQLIAAHALERARTHGHSYAKHNAPTSPLAGLSGNRVPEYTEIKWLRGLDKCNQFVGDVLTLSSWEMPIYYMADGSKHYRNAEQLPKERNHFKKITSLSAIQLGDLVVLDWPQRGESGAHVEIVTSLNPVTGDLFLTGASANGARERKRNNYFSAAQFNPSIAGWITPNGSQLYILRTKKPIASITS